jgi:hypothetical protein
VRQVRDVAWTRTETLATLHDEYAQVFREHPFHEPRDLVPALRQLLASPQVKEVTDFP